ncbi:hypothetical protein KUCAC02_007448, partial [Chaenocephalus aceratus]
PRIEMQVELNPLFPMLNMSSPSELKSPCVTRNGMVKLPPSQPNGLGSASITKGTPAAKNRLCQSSSPGKPLVGLKPSLRQLPPLTLPKPLLLERQLVLDEKLLNRLLWYFTTAEKCVLAQVCKTWRKVLYQPKFWDAVTPILHAKELYTLLPSGEKEFVSLQAFALRGFQSFCLVGVSDLDICEFIDNYPLSKKGVRSVSLKRSTITDAGLEARHRPDPGQKRARPRPDTGQTQARHRRPAHRPDPGQTARPRPDTGQTQARHRPDPGQTQARPRPELTVLCFLTEGHLIMNDRKVSQMVPLEEDVIVMLEQMQGLMHLELSGCNDFTEAGLWSSLNARLTSLSVSDCINVADDAIAAISQLLPNLSELSLQAYHVTDTAMAYFTAKQGYTTHTLRLHSCWEITNHGVVNMVHSLPNLTALSLSGCSKITDDGVELVAENLRKLRSLDLSWCPRITDMALEYIACDLHKLEELVLDRCVRITDTGLGYLSTMSSLRSLYLRWCCQCCLQELEELELTNCPGATAELFKYYSQHLPHCMVIDAGDRGQRGRSDETCRSRRARGASFEKMLERRRLVRQQ